MTNSTGGFGAGALPKMLYQIYNIGLVCKNPGLTAFDASREAHSPRHHLLQRLLLSLIRLTLGQSYVSVP